LKIGHVYMNLFTRNSPYYHLPKYILFLLKHPVYCRLILVLKVVLRQSIVGHWPRRTGCDPRPVNLRFVLDDVPLVQSFSEFFRFPLSAPSRRCPVFILNLVLLSSEGQEVEAREPRNDHYFSVYCGKSWTSTYFPRCCVVFKRSGNELIFVYILN
jgi:hypothetical protein